MKMQMGIVLKMLVVVLHLDPSFLSLFVLVSLVPAPKPDDDAVSLASFPQDLPPPWEGLLPLKRQYNGVLARTGIAAGQSMVLRRS